MQNHPLQNEKLLICQSDPTILEHLAASIRTYFGDILDIVAVPTSKLSEIGYTPNAAVVSELTIGAVKQRFPETEIIMQQWDLSGQALEKVVSLPKNSNVLVVNKPFSAAQETRNSLVELGINHINMIAYSPGSNVDTSNIDAVIYVGIFEQCPKLNCQYINIGIRKISLYTIIDIVRAFRLPSIHVKEYYTDIIQQFTASCYRINHALKQVNNLKENFEKICDINNNITFALDENDEILLFNEMAKKYFDSRTTDDVIGKDYKLVFSRYPELLSYIASAVPLSDTLITINEQKLLISSFDMDIGKNKNRAFILLPISTLQKREGLVRKKLRATGFVARHTFKDILGSSNFMNQSKSLAEIYAQTDAPILITGESGTGKELFAQAIHNVSSRRESNFGAINFAALPENLAESELFGYTEGAFTGALKSGKAGMFELAHEGTIFLDEIGDASLPVQAKLLRVLEEKEVLRLGGVDVIPVDVRIICATNKNLEAAIQEGTFREDLYYRIKVLNLQLTPLRKRPEDVEETLEHLLVGDQALALAHRPEVRSFLTQYGWPGNARELRTVAEYINMLATLSDEQRAVNMLHLYMQNNLQGSGFSSTPDAFSLPQVPPSAPVSDSDHAYISPDLLAILQSIYKLQNQGVTAGRNSICRMPDAVRMNLTEAKVKNRLKRLESLGYITIGRTKQGVLLTDSGYQILMQQRE